MILPFSLTQWHLQNNKLTTNQKSSLSLTKFLLYIVLQCNVQKHHIQESVVQLLIHLFDDSLIHFLTYNYHTFEDLLNLLKNYLQLNFFFNQFQIHTSFTFIILIAIQIFATFNPWDGSCDIWNAVLCFIYKIGKWD